MGMMLGASISLVSHILAGGKSAGQALIDEMVYLNDVAPTFVNASGNRYNPYNNTFAAANVRRRRPLTGGSVTLQLDLVEGVSSNVCLRSSEFDDPVWQSGGTTVPFNVATAPDGTLTAEKLAEDATNAIHYVRQGITSALGLQSFSVFAKAGERTLLDTNMSDFASGDATATFNLTLGTVSGASGSGSWTNVSASISKAGNGWYRCTLTATRGAGTGTYPTLYLNNGSGTTYPGTVGFGLYLWGAQLEIGVPFASSYTPTTTAAVTRARDSLINSLVGLAGGGLAAVAGTVMMVGVPEGRALPAGTYDLTDTANNQLSARISAGAGASGFTRAVPLASTETESDRVLKDYTLTWDVTQLRYYRNGLAAGNVAPGAPAVVPSIPMGALSGGTNEYFGYVGIMYWPRVLTPAEILAVHNALAISEPFRL